MNQTDMKKDVLERVKKLHEIFHAGGLEHQHKHEVHPELDPGSRENYLYFTLPPTLNFQRSSPAMWKAALATWDDAETNYLFFPEKIVDVSIDQVRRDLLKHRLALQPNKHIEIWTKISRAFHKHFDNDPRKLLALGNYNVDEILKLVKEIHANDFPYLRGPKMSNYWLYILNQYTNVAFSNKESISIIPDTHVQQCSIKLGLVNEGASPEVVAGAWKSLLAGSGLIPIDMHPVLWNWSRAGFIPEV